MQQIFLENEHTMSSETCWVWGGRGRGGKGKGKAEGEVERRKANTLHIADFDVFLLNV